MTTKNASAMLRSCLFFAVLLVPLSSPGQGRMTIRNGTLANPLDAADFPIDNLDITGTLSGKGSDVTALDLSHFVLTLPPSLTLQLRRGNFSELKTVVLAAGEPAWTNDTHELSVGDGSLLGGWKVGLRRVTGTSFSQPTSNTQPDIAMWFNSTNGETRMQAEIAPDIWSSVWATKPSNLTGTVNTSSGPINTVTFGVSGAATSTGAGGAAGAMSQSGGAAIFSVTSGNGGASATAHNGGAGGAVGQNFGHQIRFAGGTGGAAGSVTDGATGGIGGLGISAVGGAGGAGGSAAGANGGAGGNARPTGNIAIASVQFNGGSGAAGGTATDIVGGQGGNAGKLSFNGGNGVAGTTVSGGGGGDAGQISANGGVGAANSGLGGPGGIITLNGGAATSGVNGGRSGNITLSGISGIDGPDIISSTTSASPEGVVTATYGSLFLNQNGTQGQAWLKQANTTFSGWVPLGMRVAVPSGSAAAGAVGQWSSDDTYFYYYGATGWRRITAGATW